MFENYYAQAIKMYSTCYARVSKVLYICMYIYIYAHTHIYLDWRSYFLNKTLDIYLSGLHFTKILCTLQEIVIEIDRQKERSLDVLLIRIFF